MRKNRKRVGIVLLMVATVLGTVACQSAGNEQNQQVTEEPVVTQEEAVVQSSEEPTADAQPIAIVQQTGMSLDTRFATPEGYIKDSYEEGSFGAFVRDYVMNEDSAKVHLYDGSVKANQSSAAAVFSMRLGDRNLQQCADSVIRMYAEYFYETEQYERMNFHFVDGFECSYVKWMEGYRVTIANDRASWEKSAEPDNSYECFEKYLNVVFSYASTLSVEQECEEIPISQVKIGDVFIKAGSPGHVVMVVDVCTDEQGKKAVLLAQGYMPAQEFHVINNPRHGEDPWYYEEEMGSPFETAEYTFSDSICKRPQY